MVVITGAECGRTMGRAGKAGLELDWLEERESRHSAQPDVVYGTTKWTRHEAEMARGIQRPVQYYSMFENALRFERGESLERPSRASIEALGEVQLSCPEEPERMDPPLCFSRGDSYALAEQPPISFPYPKLMNANMLVDMELR